MRELRLKSGAIQNQRTKKEKDLKKKHKNKKKASDLKDTDIKELVFELAKKSNLI